MQVEIEFEGSTLKVSGEYHPYVPATWGRDGGTPEEPESFDWDSVTKDGAEIMELIECFKDIYYRKFERLVFAAAKEAIKEESDDRGDYLYHQREIAA